MEKESKKLDEVVVKKDFDLEAAISSLRFYWGLVRRNNEVLVMELWKDSKNLVEGGG